MAVNGDGGIGVAAVVDEDFLSDDEEADGLFEGLDVE